MHLLALFLLTASPTLAADPKSPHEHQGVVSPYPATPAAIELTADELSSLQSGKAVRKQLKGESGGRGLAVQDIKAPKSVVWGRILDYDAYPRMVDGVDECGNYRVDGQNIYTRFVISAMFSKVEYYIHHVYRKDLDYLTWTLDYGRESDLDDSVGYWYVTEPADHPGYTRVFYSVDVRIKGWVPKMVEDMIAKKGLAQATEWVKKESEAEAG